jgi:prepilin-type N-terminal cleavage/methylation domain-containing protein
MTSARRLRRRAQRGVSMIEVLVVLVLFSFGLIGIVGLQTKYCSLARPACGGERHQPQLRDEIAILRLLRSIDLRTRFDLLNQLLERRHEMGFVQHDQGISAQQPRMKRPHPARHAIA